MYRFAWARERLNRAQPVRRRLGLTRQGVLYGPHRCIPADWLPQLQFGMQLIRQAESFPTVSAAFGAYAADGDLGRTVSAVMAGYEYRLRAGQARRDMKMLLAEGSGASGGIKA